MKHSWILAPLIALFPLVVSAQDSKQDDAAATQSAPLETAPEAGTSIAPQDGAHITTETEDGASLMSETDIGTLQLQQLSTHRWTLATASDAQSQPLSALFPAGGRPYQLTFSSTGVSVRGPCNALSGAFQINAEGLLEMPPLRATMMSCEPQLMAADTALTALLAQPLRMEFLAGAIAQLQLQTPANDTLLLEGEITPEALYGPGMTIFLEVDAQRLACRNPNSTQTTCLQVRELAFDEQGLRVPPAGPWKPFYETIDGFTHVAGESNVLRVKRFERSKVAGASTPYLYVLDLVVETHAAPQ